jgi:hypothetical protein
VGTYFFIAEKTYWNYKNGLCNAYPAFWRAMRNVLPPLPHSKEITESVTYGYICLQDNHNDDNDHNGCFLRFVRSDVSWIVAGMACLESKSDLHRVKGLQFGILSPLEIVSVCIMCSIHFGIYLSISIWSMLGGSLVTTAWRVLRLRIEVTPSRCGG